MIDITFDEDDLAWTGLSKREIDFIREKEFNPLLNRSLLERENPGMRELMLMRKCPEYFYFACKILLNIEITPMQSCMLQCLWEHPFPMLIGSRGLSKSFSLALYALLRAALVPGTKVVCVGAAFRQSKILHSYINNMWLNAPVLQSIFKNSTDGTRSSADMITFTLGNSCIYFIPLGNGEKIRGLRGNVIIADEMNSLDTDVYEIVVNNFAAVSMDPVESMKRKAKIASLQKKGLDIPEELIDVGFKNQSIIAGTMGFEFQPMYRYWQKYKNIIETKGQAIKDAFDGQDLDLSYKDFCIMRLPYELIPKGFMDDKTIARAKATIHIGAYNSEYGCVPVKDTTGFFRRSILEGCVADDSSVGQEGWPEWCPSSFDAKINGEKHSQYVMGVDPASDEDNFAIVIVEVFPQHQRIVYSWTTNREEVKKNDPSANYYSYCARHIRNLMVQFNIVKIGIDAQGGGRALSEALHDKELLRPGEVPLWPEINPESRQDTDRMAGNHILTLVQFANYKWLANANHSMRKDFEGKTLLFPRYNSVLMGLASTEEFGAPELEDCIWNIEELKNELSTIVMTSTSARERWDTPQVKTDSNKVGRLRKDRYSALLIANDLAREINHSIAGDFKKPSVGLRVGKTVKQKKESGNLPSYYGNSPLSKKIGNPNYRSINR